MKAAMLLLPKKTKNPKPVILLLPLSHLSHAPDPPPPPSPPSSDEISRLAKLINSHPLPDLDNLLSRHLLPILSSSPLLLPSLLSRLLSSHSSTAKSLRLFLFSLSHLPTPPHPLSLHSTLHSLSRARLFSESTTLLSHLARSHPHPSLLSPYSLSILLSRHAKFHPFDSTLAFFHHLQQIWNNATLPFSVDHFNALLRAFSSHARMAEARAAFNRLHSRFPPDSRTLNTLLLGFKESGNILAFDLFYNEMLLRGFVPDIVTYNIRIDAYCKRNRFANAVEVFEEMERKGFAPTVQTLTTLVHGAGIVRNPFRARGMFDEIAERGLVVDRGAYNALMGALVRAGDLKGGAEVMDEMEGKGLGVDDVSYYTLFCCLKRVGDFDGVCGLYRRMVERRYVPRVRTVMLLMKYFCESRRADLGLDLWDYLVDKGCCPHRHALDLLVTGLCCSQKVAEAYECFRQVVERGRWPSERSFRMLEGTLMRLKETEKLDELRRMIKSLESLGPAQPTDYYSDAEEEV